MVLFGGEPIMGGAQFSR